MAAARAQEAAEERAAKGKDKSVIEELRMMGGLRTREKSEDGNAAEGQREVSRLDGWEVVVGRVVGWSEVGVRWDALRRGGVG